MNKHLHYELMAGSYSVVNLAEKRSALLPISFLILVDETGYSPFKSERSFVRQTLVRNQIVSHHSMIRPLFKNTDLVVENIDIRENSFFSKRIIQQELDRLSLSIVLSSLSNMMIEVYDPSMVNSRYFVYSPIRQWNLRAIEFGMKQPNLISSYPETQSILEIVINALFKNENGRLDELVTTYNQNLPEFRKIILNSVEQMERLSVIDDDSAEFGNIKISQSSVSGRYAQLIKKAIFVLFNSDSICDVCGDEYIVTNELSKMVRENCKSILVLNKFLSIDPDRVALSSIPLIEVIQENDTDYRFQFLWSEYIPTYLTECGVFAEKRSIYVTKEIENIYKLFHIPHNKE